MYLDHCRMVLSNSSHSSNPLMRSLCQMTIRLLINLKLKSLQDKFGITLISELKNICYLGLIYR